MKRPNGYGAVINLGKNRRRPWAVRVTDWDKSTTKNPDGSYTQKYTYLGYFEKKADAYEALEEFNANQTPASYAKITFSEVWRLWAERNLNEKSASRTRAYTAAYKKCEKLYKRPMVDLRLHDLQAVIDEHEGASQSALNQLKTVIMFIYEWSIKNDIIEKDYSKFIEIRPRKEKSHIPLTHLQVNELKAQIRPNNVQKMILIYLHTGARPSELIELPIENVHLDERYFEITKSKTKSGLRIVPIADAVMPLFEYFVKHSKNGKLFDIDYQQYKNFFKGYLPGHTPHDTRSTFISFMQELDIPLIVIQKIVGHRTGNITGDVYTKLSLQPLLDAVNKL